MNLWNMFGSDTKKLQAIKNVLTRYKIEITSGVLLSLYIFIMSGTNLSNKKQITEVPSSYAIALNDSKELMVKSSPDISEENLTNEEKISQILTNYNLTFEEFDTCAAIAIAEANGDGTNYEEAHNVINAAYNRIISSTWVNYLDDNLYIQMTAPSQFTVYESKAYQKYLGRFDLPGYQAVIDFLSNTSDLIAHNYLSFRSNDSSQEGRVELVEGGNLYFNELVEEDRLEDIRQKPSSLIRTLKKS